VLTLAAISPTAVYAMMAFGFALAVMGHVFRDQRIVGIGIAILFIATALLLLGAYQDYNEHGSVI
jgi:ABC-type polysaccharide/polyol phosphate export permease